MTAVEKSCYCRTQQGREKARTARIERLDTLAANTAEIIDQLVQNDFAQDDYGDYSKGKGDHYITVSIESYDPMVQVRRYNHNDTQIGATETFKLPVQTNQLLAVITR